MVPNRQLLSRCGADGEVAREDSLYVPIITLQACASVLRLRVAKPTIDKNRIVVSDRGRGRNVASCCS